MSTLADTVAGWTPATVTSTDVLRRWPVDAFAALLDQPAPTSEHLPPLWHWLFFLGHPRSDELGVDGHEADGHFLPPIPRRRRMFAGGRVEFRAPLPLGAAVERTGAIAAITPKSGRSGDMLFVTERREFTVDGTLAVVEEQDIVYRQASGEATRAPGSPPDPLPLPDDGSVGLVPDPRLLLRFSALTYNAHRIHHDENYARDVEGYPGLVVHGPLLALLLLEPARRAGRAERIAGFDFRLRRPAFAGTPVVVTDAPELTAGPVGGEPCVTGSITWN
ncbi:hypothetical protein WCD74_22035 [Actinomycetospora sp. OC33-EN08]|uniref:N-terminal of MaoC-like dehydratase domain-containing protein n=1 Tax=Actinomycetospora aurantiaca TaxID=3129233 RepID=A0ABU8MV04_9PSEU